MSREIEQAIITEIQQNFNKAKKANILTRFIGNKLYPSTYRLFYSPTNSYVIVFIDDKIIVRIETMRMRGSDSPDREFELGSPDLFEKVTQWMLSIYVEPDKTQKSFGNRHDRRNDRRRI
jgi:hypothetical protein